VPEKGFGLITSIPVGMLRQADTSDNQTAVQRDTLEAAPILARGERLAHGDRGAQDEFGVLKECCFVDGRHEHLQALLHCPVIPIFVGCPSVTGALLGHGVFG
jgi:hypothetical protein